MSNYTGIHDFAGAIVLGIAAGGGGGITVGASGTSEYPTTNYSSVGEAVAAGHNNIMVVSDTIETSTITVPTSGLLLKMENANVFLNGAGFSVPNLRELSIIGRGSITVTGSVAIITSLGTSNVYINGVDMDARALSSSASPINSSTIGFVSLLNMSFYTSNGTTGLETAKGRIDNLKIIAAGTSTLRGIYCDGANSYIHNLEFANYGGGAQATIISGNKDGVTIDGVNLKDTAPTTLEINVPGINFSLNNFNRHHGLLVLRAKSGLSISNSRAGFAAIGEAIENATFTNVVASGFRSLQVQNEFSNNNRYAACDLGVPSEPITTTPFTFWGNNNRFDATLFRQNVTMQGSGHILNGCDFLGDFTIATNSSGIILTDCRIRGTFTDNGTDTVGTTF